MSAADSVRQHRLSANRLELSVLELAGVANGNGSSELADLPCVVMLHGLRDSAWSLLPVATDLARGTATHPGFRVLLPELRGHGDSGRSDAYAMPDFLIDLHAAIEQFSQGNCALFGHSLGGHIATRYAALFPEIVQALIVAEGLGPPKRPHEGDPAAEIRAYRARLVTQLAARPSRARPIADLADVAQRLLSNNPRLPPAQAEAIAPHLVETVEGQLRWAFDSRANRVFLGVSTTDNVRFWEQVSAPTCIISGALSYEYWGREMNQPGFSGHFAEGEMETRVQHFKNHEHHWFEHSGHMVHYDEPQRLGALCRQFLEQHYV